ncbi:hypothetical protein, partial [Staphylococcus condimenti]|uniref:hypothetical protein n=1 Tax=Staphylococcus condimenti TaxID=70255 RepID=UPI0013EE6177
DAGDDGFDSGCTSLEVTEDNADALTIDSGFYKRKVEPTPVPATYIIGDKVWNCTIKEGLQNSNEPGIQDIRVTLTK